jgi:hypothetical protein
VYVGTSLFYAYLPYIITICALYVSFQMNTELLQSDVWSNMSLQKHFQTEKLYNKYKTSWPRKLQSASSLPWKFQISAINHLYMQNMLFTDVYISLLL